MTESICATGFQGYEMDTHQEFTRWAIAQGVKLDGIAVHKFPGRGLGIIAKKRFEVGDTILTIPISALRSAQTVRKKISRRIGTITVQGLLAADLAMDTSETRAPWRAVLPIKNDFEESTPIFWQSSLQALLPPAALSLLEKQQKKLSSDWTAVSIAFPSLSYEIYLYNWLLIGTRTFYYTSPKLKVKKPLHRDECLALVPFADYFNHADRGCEVSFSLSGYTVCTDRRIEEGEEIHISYGNHSNDFLLAEYGFILDDNKWDEISLDEVLLPLFSDGQKQTLKEAGFLGNYALDSETVSYRIQVALSLLHTTPNKWHRLVANGLEDGDEHQAAVDQVMLKALKTQLDGVQKKLIEVKALDCGLPSQRETLTKRWKQIHLLLTAAIYRIEN